MTPPPQSSLALNCFHLAFRPKNQNCEMCKMELTFVVCFWTRPCGSDILVMTEPFMACVTAISLTPERGASCSGIVAVDPEETPSELLIRPVRTLFTCPRSNIRDSNVIRIAVVFKETSNGQCGSRRLEARQCMFNAHAGSRVKSGRDSGEQQSRQPQTTPQHPILAATRDQARIYRRTPPPKNKGDEFLDFHVLLLRCESDPLQNLERTRTTLVTNASRLNFVKSSDIMLTRVSLAANHRRGTSELCQGQKNSTTRAEASEN